MDAARAVTIDVRRGADRFVTRREGIELRHSFSFGQHYDAANTPFGLLLASNEMRLAPGAGFEPHPHRDIEIVTWVLAGALVHPDSSGAGGVIVPGMAQRLSTGRAVEHSERASASSPTQVVQMWVAPDAHGFEPSYEQLDISEELEAAGWSLSRPATRSTSRRCAFTSVTRRCTWLGSRLARRWSCPLRRTCTCT